jgi:Protein of unknown function (DUF1631)
MDTPVRPAGRAAEVGARSVTESRALLSQCRELARSKLSGIITEALNKIENDLFSLAEASTSRAEQQVLFEAMAHVKKYRGEISHAFDGYFIEVFDQRISARRARAAAARNGEPSLAELSILDDAALEEDLVISDLARKTRNRIDPDELLGIRARFGHLLAQEVLEDETNPLSPEAVFEALKLACAKIPGDFAVKRSLLNAFQPYVAAGITRVYADVNQNLISHHVLPRIKHTVKRAVDGGGLAANAFAASQAMNLAQLWGSGAGGSGVSMGASQGLNVGQLLGATGGMPGTGMPGGGGMSLGQPGALGMSGPLDLSALLAGVMQGPPAVRAQVTRMLADPARYALESALSTPASPALMTSLSALQAAPMAIDGGFDFMAAIGEQIRAQSHPLDQLTIELVSMVFDYILEDKAVPETVKGEIARLQIVAVKAAILDRTFFARRQHPMRQLLDRIAEVASDPEIATDEQSKFVLGLRGVVDYIVHKFTDDLTLFSVALDTIEKIVEENRQSQQKALAPTTVELTRKEEAEIAHATALAEIKRRVTRRTPAFVRDFLYAWWTKTLVDGYMRKTEGDDSWTHRLGVVDALVWSVSPLKTPEIQQLASMLPMLMRSLLRGMNAIEMPADARHAFFNLLMQTHTASINTAKAQKSQTAGTSSDATDQDAQQGPDLAPITEPGAPDNAAEKSPVSDYYLHTAMALERGAVVEFVDNQKTVRSKLSWVSPKQTIMLFTSSLAGARQFAPNVLADLLRDGRARVVEASEALMDRVVGVMMGPESLPAVA